MGTSEWIKQLKSMTKEEKFATVEVDDVSAKHNRLIIHWSGIFGFGEVVFWFQDTEKGVKIECDSECMSRDFVINLLTKMAFMALPDDADDDKSISRKESEYEEVFLSSGLATHEQNSDIYD